MPVTVSRQRMLHSDAFAWYMEKDAVLRSTVVAIIRLDRSPDWERLHRRTDRLTRLVPKLRMRVQVPPLRIGPPLWTVDDSFDLDFHLRRANAPGAGTWADVLEFARVCAMDDFDRSRPLWEFTLLDGLADGGAAFVTKLHHALTDGIGGLQLAALVIDAGPEEILAGPLPQPPPSGTVSELALTASTVAGDAREALSAATRVMAAAPAALASAVRHPVGAVRSAVGAGRSVGRFVAPVNEQFSTVLGTRRTHRVLATLEVPLDELRAAAAAAGAHINDAFLAALTEGVRRYHEDRGEALHQVRITVPVSIRAAADEIGGNRITLTRMTVPADVTDPAERIRKISTVVRRWRHEPALGHAQEIAFGLNLLPRAYLGSIFKRIELLASDVPGLTAGVWLAGAKVTGYYGFGPTIGAGLNATLMSYVDTCDIGVNIDTGAVTDPDLMLACLREGFEQVLALGRARGSSGRQADATATARRSRSAERS
jgi:WS/DGAT/MGAT family acyltransferase